VRKADDGERELVNLNWGFVLSQKGTCAHLGALLDQEEATMKTPATKDRQPDRNNLGPTGPAKAPSAEKQADYEAKHPNPGNVVSADDPNVGPTPTADPRGKAGTLGEKTVDKRSGK
jgi:hypothetical protein